MAQTTKIKLTDDRWTDLGVGPGMLGAHGGELYFAIGDEPEAQDSGFLQRFDANPVVIPAAERIWARACFGGRYASAVFAHLGKGYR